MLRSGMVCCQNYEPRLTSEREVLRHGAKQAPEGSTAEDKEAPYSGSSGDLPSRGMMRSWGFLGNRVYELDLQRPLIIQVPAELGRLDRETRGHLAWRPPENPQHDDGPVVLFR